MANNTQLNAGSGGDSIADVDLTNFAGFGYPTTTGKLPVCALYVSQAIGTAPTPVTTSNTLPVTIVGAIPAGASTIGNVGLVAGSATVGKVNTNADCTIAAGTAPADAFAIAGVYNTTNPAAGAGQTVGLQTDPGGALRVTGSGLMPTFSSSASFAPAASATDIATLTGSATKTIKVLRVKVQLSTNAATAQNVVVQLIKRAAVDSGGTSSSMTVVPHRGTDVATATALSYTANPTINNTVGALDTFIAAQQTTPSAGQGANTEVVFDFTAPGMTPPILSGIAQQLAVNLGGATVTATATAKVTFVHSEE